MPENMKVLKQNLDAFSKRDMDAVLKGIHPDIVVRQVPSLPYGGTYRGVDEFLGVLNALGTYWHELTIAPHTFLDAGDTIVVRFDFNATSKATGIEVRTEMAEFFSFKDGLVSGIDVFFWDVQELLNALPAEASN